MENLFEYLISKKNKKKVTIPSIHNVADLVVDFIISYWDKYISFPDELKDKHDLRCTAPTGKWNDIYGNSFPKELMQYFEDPIIDLKKHMESRIINIDDIVSHYFKNKIFDPDIIADQINSWIDNATDNSIYTKP